MVALGYKLTQTTESHGEGGRNVLFFYLKAPLDFRVPEGH